MQVFRELPIPMLSYLAGTLPIAVRTDSQHQQIVLKAF